MNSNRNVAFDQSWSEAVKKLWGHDVEEMFDSKKDVTKYRLYQYYLNEFSDFFQKNISKDKSILDLGCAQGNFAIRLADLGYNVTAVDIRADFIDYVKLKDTNHRLTFICSNILDLPEEKKYDVVYLGEVIEHTLRATEILSKINRLLKDNGLLVLTTPSQEYCRNKLPSYTNCKKDGQAEFFPDGNGHFFFYRTEELTHFLETSGFAIKKIKYYRSLFLCGDLKFRNLHRFLPEKIHYIFEGIISGQPFFRKKLMSQKFVVARKIIQF